MVGASLAAEISRTKYIQNLAARETDKPKYELNLAVREINEPKARPAQTGTAPKAGKPKGRLNLERWTDVTDGFAYTRGEFVDRYRNAEERQLTPAPVGPRLGPHSHGHPGAR